MFQAINSCVNKVKWVFSPNSDHNQWLGRKVKDITQSVGGALFSERGARILLYSIPTAIGVAASIAVIILTIILIANPMSAPIAMPLLFGACVLGATGLGVGAFLIAIDDTWSGVDIHVPAGSSSSEPIATPYQYPLDPYSDEYSDDSDSD